MPDDPYSLADLARLAGVTPRTVRYYVAQGLLPSPDAAGPATRYGEGHLTRLRLIKRLQRDHLPLAEIRARLERMGDDEVEALLDEAGLATPEPRMSTDETLAYVRLLMTQAGVAPRFYDRQPDAAAPPPATPPAAAPSLRRTVPDGFPIREDPWAIPGPTPTTTPSPAPSAPSTPPLPVVFAPTITGPARQVAGDRSTWERLAITPDVEIHVRRPLDRRTNKLVERLARIARELFDDEP
jgi:DNA-binding transcriptional MerR regulator